MHMQTDHNIIDRYFAGNDFAGHLCYDESKNLLRFGYDAEWEGATCTVYEFERMDEFYSHMDERFGEGRWR